MKQRHRIVEGAVWRLRLVCCGREDGSEEFRTWAEADSFRESYTSGPAVHPRGYSGETGDGFCGHQRAAILESK